MRIEVRSQLASLTASIRRRIERRMQISLRAFAHYIEAVTISVRDINGPRGGRDKLGQVIVKLRRGNMIVVRAKDESLPALVSRLATAVRRAVKARIRRRQMHPIRTFRRLYRPLAVTGSAAVAVPHEIGI